MTADILAAGHQALTSWEAAAGDDVEVTRSALLLLCLQSPAVMAEASSGPKYCLQHVF